uniref:Immunoglobulin domain-containing protein n=1 Tax=Pundamilia nyererei TaxID=303518 RepID=A0A3B4FAM8_9CICH
VVILLLFCRLVLFGYSLWFTVCCNSVTKIESYAGYSVSFSCLYQPQYQNNLKYICRGTRPSMCLQQALITSYNKKNGRFRLNDENMSTKFTTKISSLTQSDSGRYLCGIQRNSDLHLFYAFELKVKDRCCDTVTNIESYEGYSESINCPHENQYQNSLKYICRGNQPSTCLQDALITSNNRENGRFRLNDVKMSRIFTVTISSLTQSDSGHYLCGVQTNSDHDVFSAVELRVKGESSAKCLSENHKKEVCIFTAFCFSDSALYVPFTVPLVLLLLIGILVVVVYKWKHYKVKGIFYIHTHAESHPLKCACEKSITVFSAVCFQKMKPLWTQMHPRQKV